MVSMQEATGGPAPRALAARRLSPALAAGLLASAGVAVTAWGALPASTFATAAPWMKGLMPAFRPSSLMCTRSSTSRRSGTWSRNS
jgi:uncharacterized RDD family membrane protein YckC